MNTRSGNLGQMNTSHVILLLGISLTIMFGTVQSVYALPFVNGDVFVGVGSGQIKVFDQTGALKQTLNTGSGSTEQTGMCFDATHMYATDFTAGQGTKFDFNGVVVTHPWAGPFSNSPESCVVDAAGDIYTGEVDGASDIRKWDAAGNPLATFNPTVGPRGTDWIDLRADQCTMRYTSEGTAIHQFDVCTNTQLADFATGLPGRCFGHRELPNGEHLVACQGVLHRLNSAGVIQQTITAASLNPPAVFLFALNLDPDGTHLWTADIGQDDVYKIRISDLSQQFTFNAAAFTSTAGLAIFGEITVSQCPPGTTGMPPNCIPIDVLVGGTLIPIDSSSLLLAGAQMSASWLIPVIVSSIGIGLVLVKKSKNS